MRNILLFLSSSFLLLALFTTYYINNNFDTLTGTGFYIILSCLLSLFAISLGWWVSLYISKRQSTLNVILQSRLSEYYLSEIKNFESVFPSSKVMTLDAANDNPEALDSLLVVLNYLEFISVGIKHGDLSESVCKAFFIKIFANQWYRCSEYINHCHIHGDVELFKNFEFYAKKWNPILNK